MPCSKGMKGCRRDCLHRKMVEEYRDSVWARDSLRESDTPVTGVAGAGDGLVVCYQLSDEEFKQHFPPVLFKDWLIANKKEEARMPEGDGRREGADVGYLAQQHAETLKRGEEQAARFQATIDRQKGIIDTQKTEILRLQRRERELQLEVQELKERLEFQEGKGLH